jgi:FkbM family methyltransferase
MPSQTAIEPVGRNLGFKRATAAVLCHPLAGWLLGRLFRGRIPHRGIRIEVPRGGDLRVNAALFWGIYESAEIRFVRQFIDGTLDVVELGSSLGAVSSEIGRRLGPERRLVCVEANASLIDVLRRNLAANVAHLQPLVVYGAISHDGRREVEFEIGKSNLSSHLGAADGRSQRVPAHTLGEVVARADLGDFALVSDIEGAEAALFEHEAETLQRCRLLIIELHSVRHVGIDHTPDTLIRLIERQTPLRLRARYGAVCAFSR